jgi:4-hydroxybenzoate polyprenyltransferase
LRQGCERAYERGMNDKAAGSASDIPAGGWIDRRVPAALRPYLRLARLDRPIGTWLLLLPCWWSVSLASPGWPDPVLLLLFAGGALLMRGAGCTFNDMVDRDIDARVARTADRPLASGAISLRQAVVFLLLLTLAAFVILLQFNGFAIWTGIASLAVVALYPFAKRITHWPQAVLGLAFNWGALLGWAAVRGDITAPALALYVAGLFWTLGYDTVYAHQDKEDDRIVGVKSSALKLGDRTRPWLFAFFGLAILLIAEAGHQAGLAWPFYAVLALGAVHAGWQAATVDIDDPKDCLAKFRSNRDFGLIVFVAIVLGKIF